PTDSPAEKKPPANNAEKAVSNSSPAVAGVQTPSLALEKLGPAAVRAGEPFHYELVVRNVGTVPAAHARLEDELPPGTRFLGALPPPLGRGGRLVWELDPLPPGAERRIRVEVQPAGAGEWTGAATVTVSASSALRAAVTGPPLTLGVTGPRSVALGQTA